MRLNIFRNIGLKTTSHLDKKPKKTSSLGKKLLFYIIICSSTVTTVFTIINFYFDYTIEMDLLESTFSQIEKATVPSLSRDVWDVNDQNVKQHIKSIINITDIVGAWVVNEKGDVFVEEGKANERSEYIVKRSYPLSIGILFLGSEAEADGDKSQVKKVGTLYVLATKMNMYERLYNKLLLFFITQGLKTFFVSFCILFIVHFFIINHLSHITKYIIKDNFKDASLESTLVLARKEKKRPDELDILVESINDLKHEIVDHNSKREQYLKLKEAAEKELQILNKDLDRRVKERTEQLKKAQNDLIERAHKAGMADIARDSLHTIGNLINSVMISLQVHQFEIRDSRNYKVAQKSQKVLEDNMARLTEFFHEEKGEKMAKFLLPLIVGVVKDYKAFHESTVKITKAIDDISSFLGTQREIVDAAGEIIETMPLKDVLEEAVSVNQSYLSQKSITINLPQECDYLVNAQRYKAIIVITHIIRNAVEAIENSENKNQEINISITEEDGYIKVDIIDNGCGIDKENITNVFSYGFSTKKDKKGSGLHLSANYMTEMNGKIEAYSDGVMQGTTISIKFHKEEGGLSPSQNVA